MILCLCYIYILYSVCNCILMQGHPLDYWLCYLDDPSSLSILLLPIFLYSLVVLCLVGYVNLTFMPCKTELRLINHLVLSCLVEAEVKEEVKRLFDKR